MRRAIFPLLLIIGLPIPALACSLCGNLSRSVSLAQEFDDAQAIAYGRIANPKFDPSGLGGGTTEFHVEKIIRDDGGLIKQKAVLLSRYLPILDAKDPPHYVMFFRRGKDKVEPYNGRQVDSLAVLDFVAALQKQDDAAKKLALAFKHLDDKNAQVADEAFLVFARADDKVIAQHGKKLDPVTLRKLIKTPDLEPERLSLFAYLLGACGTAEDAEVLRGLLNDPAQRHFKAFEGILAGYITMRPKEGWAYTQQLLQSDKASFLLRYASLRTMRFFYNAKQDEVGAQVIQQLGLAIQQSDVADIAITDLRNWQRWDHTKLIVSCYDKSTHKSQIVKNCIVRYALACPQPEARALVERVRREDPGLVKYLEGEPK